MPKRLIALLLLATSLNAGEITIAVAANVSYAIDSLKTAFVQKHPDITVRSIVGSSGKLTAQIRNGAPYGLFMSADLSYPEALYKEGLAITKPTVYARGALALFSTKHYDMHKGLPLLTDESIRRIAIANPRTAPYGKAAKEALEKSGLYDSLRKKFVYGESIAQTVSYALSAADIGIIAKSSLYSPALRHYKEGVNWITIDPKTYTPIEQGIVLLKSAEGNPDYRAFYDFVLGTEAQKIFAAYGYLE
jgi:molybdate transport system substrate-binding protein